MCYSDFKDLIPTESTINKFIKTGSIRSVCLPHINSLRRCRRKDAASSSENFSEPRRSADSDVAAGSPSSEARLPLWLGGQLGVVGWREASAQVLQDVERQAADQGDGGHLPQERHGGDEVNVCHRSRGSGHNTNAAQTVRLARQTHDWWCQTFSFFCQINVRFSLSGSHVLLLSVASGDLETTMRKTELHLT